MELGVTSVVFLGIAALPVFYYLIVLYSSWRFFRRRRVEYAPKAGFAPPVSIVKPIRGVDPEAYENFASFCHQDYPEYEILFCVSRPGDPILPVIEKLAKDFPERPIRVLFNSGGNARNDKVAKLISLTREAKYEHLVISDSEVRVRPDYLRAVIAPLADSKVGAVTCFYVATNENSFAEKLQTIGMVSDFYAGILVARQLDGVKFTLGPSIATTRTRLAEFGGYQAIQDRPADDLLVGRLIADLGYKVELLPYTVETVADYQSMGGLFHKRLRWIVVMRHMRPWGHLGLLLTQGLPWSLAAIAIHPTAAVAAAYLGIYLAFRIAMTWMIDVWGLKQTSLWKKLPLIVVWDAMAFLIWLASFVRKTVRWRDGEYLIQNGLLVPTAGNPADK